MMSQIPLIDKIYILERFEGKGGWTFARIPEIVPRKDVRFGWIRVREPSMVMKLRTIGYSQWEMACFFTH